MKDLKITFNAWDSRNPRDLFTASKEIYNALESNLKVVIDNANIQLHKAQLFDIPIESTIADELLIYSQVLIKSGFIFQGIKLFFLISPYCSWKIHFFVQNNISPLLKKNRDNEELYFYLFHIACIDYASRDSYLKLLKGAKMPSWEKLLAETIWMNNLLLAEQICNEGIKNKIPYGVNGYDKKKLEIIKKKSEALSTISDCIPINLKDNSMFTSFYLRLKEKLVNNDLYENLKVENISNNRFVIKYHNEIMYCFDLLANNVLLFKSLEEDSMYGIQIVLDNIENEIILLKKSLKSLFVI